MRKVMCLIFVLAMSLTLACPVFATGDTFVPSITYKDGPDIESAEMGDETVTDCLVVTSIKEAEEKSTDITQDDRDLLLEVYDELSSGDLELPINDGEYVIRELVDVSFKNEDCVTPGHGHKEELAEDGTTVTIQFDLGVDASTEVVVMVYIDGQWIAVESVTNNGDGTVTCVFEDICPVVFCVEADAEDTPVKTGDTYGQSLILWFALMAVSFCGILVLVLLRRKTSR